MSLPPTALGLGIAADMFKTILVDGIGARVTALNAELVALGKSWSIDAPAAADIRIGDPAQGWPASMPAVRILPRAGGAADGPGSIGLTERVHAITVRVYYTVALGMEAQTDEVTSDGVETRALALLDACRAALESGAAGNAAGVYNLFVSGEANIGAVQRRDSTDDVIAVVEQTWTVWQHCRDSYGAWA